MYHLCLITCRICAVRTICVTHQTVYIRNLTLSAVSFSLPLPVGHETRRRSEIQLATLYLRLQAVYSQHGKCLAVHTRSVNVNGCVPTLLFSCIRLYKYERGRRSQCFPTQIMHGPGSLLPVVFYVMGLPDRAGFLS